MPALRVAELLVALSLAVDLGLGQPAGHVARAAVVASRINDRLPAPAERTTVFDVAMLGWVGCIADSRDTARWFGDDITYRAGVYDLDMKPLPFLGYLLRYAGRGEPLPVRAGKKVGVLLDGGRSARDSLRAHCQVTAQVAGRLGMPEEVTAALPQIFARWDGKGLPAGVSGEQIALPVRVWQLADLIEVHHARGGAEAVRQVCLARRGGQLDPTVVDITIADVEPLFDRLSPHLSWEDALIDEWGPGPPLAASALDSALEALGDWVDLKSAWFTGHSRAVADLAAAAGTRLGLAPEEVKTLRRAALLADIGRAGVPNTIWDKQGPLTTAEVERVRLHSYLTERTLQRAGVLGDIAEIAALAHERLDGSGYHRGLRAPAIPDPARVLAAADVYATKVEPRPHRAALDPSAASEHLQSEAAAGRLDPRAVSAVLEAAGHERPVMPAPYGLTPREAEVLGLIATGLTNRQVASRLGISAKTVGNHVEHVYSKTGVSTRAAATLLAMEHRLVRRDGMG